MLGTLANKPEIYAAASPTPHPLRPRFCPRINSRMTSPPTPPRERHHTPTTGIWLSPTCIAFCAAARVSLRLFEIRAI